MTCDGGLLVTVFVTFLRGTSLFCEWIAHCRRKSLVNDGPPVFRHALPSEVVLQYHGFNAGDFGLCRNCILYDDVIAVNADDGAKTALVKSTWRRM